MINSKYFYKSKCPENQKHFNKNYKIIINNKDKRSKKLNSEFIK